VFYVEDVALFKQIPRVVFKIRIKRSFVKRLKFSIPLITFPIILTTFQRVDSVKKYKKLSTDGPLRLDEKFLSLFVLSTDD